MSGTPNTQKELLAEQLAQKLAQPKYKLLVDKRMTDDNVRLTARGAALDAYKARQTPDEQGNRPGYQGKAPKAIYPMGSIEGYAKGCTNRAFGTEQAPAIMDPVKVAEIGMQRSFSLYRVFDGSKAMTDGAWWTTAATVRSVLADPACNSKTGIERQKIVRERLAQLMFVHPAWNENKFIAKMDLGSGRSTVAIVARGNWKALMNTEIPGKPGSKVSGPGDLAAFTLADEPDVTMTDTPGLVQLFIPLIDPMYVTKVPDLSPNWPFS